jgi:hypothetical protein
VGSGAIGCEILKNWAMMGVGSLGTGVVNVTDMDTIEVPHFSRNPETPKPETLKHLKKTPTPSNTQHPQHLQHPQP